MQWRHTRVPRKYWEFSSRSLERGKYGDKWVKWIFWFPSAYRSYVYTSVQYHMSKKQCMYPNFKVLKEYLIAMKCNHHLSHQWITVVMSKMTGCCIRYGHEKVWNSMRITKTGQRHEVSRCCWKSTRHTRLMQGCLKVPTCKKRKAVKGNKAKRNKTRHACTQGFPGSTLPKDPPSNAASLRRPRFSPWSGEVPWSREWQPTPVSLPGKSHGQRSLVGYSSWGRRELDTTEYMSRPVDKFFLSIPPACI